MGFGCAHRTLKCTDWDSASCARSQVAHKSACRPFGNNCSRSRIAAATLPQPELQPQPSRAGRQPAQQAAHQASSIHQPKKPLADSSAEKTPGWDLSTKIASAEKTPGALNCPLDTATAEKTPGVSRKNPRQPKKPLVSRKNPSRPARGFFG